MRGWPVLLSEIRSFSVVHLELGLLKGPEIAKPLKRELHERTEERDPNSPSSSRLCCVVILVKAW